MSNREYISESRAPDNPVVLFDIWYRQHLAEGSGITESVFLGTASPDGNVSIRTVLLKDYGEEGFIFFSNYYSRKGAQLESNHNAALLFYWQEVNRQVRIEGITEKTSESLSDAYFKTRPRDSQIAAWASEQSMEIPDREYLEERFSHYNALFTGPVPRPEHWGGYRVIPQRYEFWEDRENRLHDRIGYTKNGSVWQISRLAP